MNNSPVSSFDIMLLSLEFLITLSSLYATWVNLAKKKISKIGFDAFILFFYNIFDKRREKMIRTNPELIKRMGIITLLVGIGGINETASIFIERIWPYIH